MLKKYYFFSAAQYYNPPHMGIINGVCMDEHPFDKISWMNEHSNYIYALISYQRITKKEYELFLQEYKPKNYDEKV